MEKYEKLFKGLEMCAGPDCNPECPYHGETRGGKTCRAWLLTDAAAALAGEETKAEAAMHELKEAHLHIGAMEKERAAKPATGVPDVVLDAVKAMTKATMQAIRDAEYWRGQADALKEVLRFYCGGQAAEDVSLDLPDMHGEPELEAGSHD